MQCFEISVEKHRLLICSTLLIPGPIGARCVTVDHLQLDLGSVINDCKLQAASLTMVQG